MKTKQIGFTLIELLISISIIGILLIVLSPAIGKVIGFGTVYSEGERTGVIVKLSKKGYVWKTWEGEMNLGGMSVNGGGTAIPNRWRFSIIDDAVANQGMDLAKNAERVTIIYKEVLKSALWQGETDYIVIGFRQ